jgi:hypothetical protein
VPPSHVPRQAVLGVIWANNSETSDEKQSLKLIALLRGAAASTSRYKQADFHLTPPRRVFAVRLYRLCRQLRQHSARLGSVLAAQPKGTGAKGGSSGGAESVGGVPVSWQLYLCALEGACGAELGRHGAMKPAGKAHCNGMAVHRSQHEPSRVGARPLPVCTGHGSPPRAAIPIAGVPKL